MKKILCIGAIFVLLGAGCSEGPTNDSNIAEYKKCQEAGMESAINGFNQVVCVPKQEVEVTPKKLCEEKGGVPIESLWDSSKLKDCKFK